jgi:outer membrane protein OmpA-like peptidoglycan-associated protein
MEPLFIWTGIILLLPFLSSEPKTTVVLLDNNSTHNAIDVSTSSGSVAIDQPYYYTLLTSSDQHPSTIEKGDPEAIRSKYGVLLDALPSKAVSLLFYFEEGTANLTQSSKDQVSSLIKLIESRAPAAVDIIGHSDRSGNADKNYVLALERAKTVEIFLLEKNVKMDHKSVTSRGENDPVVPTADGVSEPLNRRVEVIVR